MRPLPLAALALLAVATSVRPAAAAWPNSPFANLPVAVSQFAQDNHVIVSDGAGGAIVVWDDLRNGVAKDIYAHHILASGVLDPSPTWTAGGRWVSGAPSNQEFPDAIEDGAGGALICWTDLRGSAADIYAQHVLASGAIDPAWPANGRAICTAASLQLLSKLTSDGAGGAIITWNDYRDNATTEPDIYAPMRPR